MDWRRNVDFGNYKNNSENQKVLLDFWLHGIPGTHQDVTESNGKQIWKINENPLIKQDLLPVPW